MKELVEFLVKSLVDHPEEVSLNQQEADDTLLMELKISPDDLGKIIGKNGNTINAIRTVLQAAAPAIRSVPGWKSSLERASSAPAQNKNPSFVNGGDPDVESIC